MRTFRGIFSALPRPRHSLTKRLLVAISTSICFLVFVYLMTQSAKQTLRIHIKRYLRLSSNWSSIEVEKSVELPWNASLKSYNFPYKYLINEPNFCQNISNLYILNIVGVGPNEHGARMRIRNLWGNIKWLNMTGFRTVFLVGATTDLKPMDDVKQESSLYRDIIQFDFLDTYDNLTVKTLCALHWVNQYCPTPLWVLKSDIDVLINVFELSRYLRLYDEKTNQTRNQLLCRMRKRAKPCRPDVCHRIKWRVTYKEYPHSYYPPYCMGPGYIIPKNLVAPLYNAAIKKRPFRIEDTYYTGLLPMELGWTNHIKPINDYFPWRPRSWMNSFVKTDLMILELDKWLGRAAASLVWSNILHHQRLVPSNNYTQEIHD